MAVSQDSSAAESIDFLIIAPMEEECLAILGRLGDYRTLPSSERHDPRVYHLSTIRAARGSAPATFSVAVTQLLQMGRVEGANAAKDGIRRWNPRYVIIAGIAGGVAKNGVRIGDVLIADTVHDYELQKLTEDGPLPRRQSYPVSPRLLAAAQNFFGDTWTDGLSDNGHRPHRIVGPMASGDKVVADSKALDWLLRNCSSKLIGVEMEAGGVASAAHQSGGVQFFMVRAASDLADPQKDAANVLNRRAYACDVAATYLVRLLESGLVAPLESVPRASSGRGDEVAATVDMRVSLLRAEFVGRAEETRRLQQFLDSHASGLLLVTAGAGYGKSALLAHWSDQIGRAGAKVVSYFFNRDFGLTSVKDACRHLVNELDRLGLAGADAVRDVSAAPARALYNALKGARLADGRRLIVLIDALDEGAAGISWPPFPLPLPHGVFVVASVRAGETEQPEQLTDWFAGADRLTLQALGLDDVRAWLASAAGGALRPLAADRMFVGELMRRTDGFPLYLHYLFEELRDDVAAGGNGRDVVARTPYGFYTYVRRQLCDIAGAEPRAAAEPLLALLSIVLGPIAELEIQIITSLSPFDLLSLPSQVRRWFTVRRLADNRVVYSLGHPLLAKEFATALAASVDRLRAGLLDHCSRWREHQGAYALQYYVDHLGAIEDRQSIYALARDDEFRDLQETKLPDQPTINLGVIRAAIETAAAEDNIVTVVEFLLRHYDQLCRVFSQSPLEAFRNGRPERAWRLADVHPADYAVLWKLLFAAEAMETNQPGKAAAIVKRLREGALPEYVGWKREYATELLLRTINLKEVVDLVTTRHFLEDQGQRILSQALLDRGLTSEAAAAARMLSSARARQDQLTKVAGTLQARFEQQRSRGDLRNAEISRHQALGLLEEVLGKERLDDILEGVDPPKEEQRPSAQELAKDLLDRLDRDRTPEQREDDDASKAALGRAETGDFPAAFGAANAIRNEYLRRDTTWKLVLQQVAVGDHDVLREMIRSIPQKEDRERAWCAAALSYAEKGDLARASDAAEQLDPNEWWSVEAFGGIATAQAKAGQFEASLASTRRMSRRWDNHHSVLLFIAERQRETGLDWDARTTIAHGIVPDIQGYEEIKELSRDELLTLRGDLLAHGGQLEEAFRTAFELAPTYDRGSLLRVIAELYAKSGAFDRARSIADEIEWDWERRWAFQTLAVEQAKLGRSADAISSAARIKVVKDRAKALCAVAEQQLAAGDCEGAVATIDVALREATAVEFGSDKVRLLGEAAPVLSSAGARARAQEILSVAAPQARTLADKVDRKLALRYLAEAHAKSGHFDEALALSDELERTDEQDGGLLYVIATEQAKASNSGTASTVSRIRDIKHRTGVWCWVAKEHHSAGDLAAAYAAMESAVNCVSQLEKPENQAEAFARIGEGWAALGRPSDARTAFDRARQLADTIDDALEENSERRIAFEDLASAQARAGCFDAARENAELIHEDYFRESVLSLIANQQAEAGRGADAVRTFEAIRFDAALHLDDFAYALGRGKDASAVKAMLVPASHDRKAVLAFTKVLGQLYPVHAAIMADRVLAFMKERAMHGNASVTDTLD